MFFLGFQGSKAIPLMDFGYLDPIRTAKEKDIMEITGLSKDRLGAFSRFFGDPLDYCRAS